MIFLSNFERLFGDINMVQPAFTIILRDFNVRSKSWWSDDLTTMEGSKLDSLTAIYGFHQVISKLTHILSNSLSCIDLIFTN